MIMNRVLDNSVARKPYFDIIFLSYDEPNCESNWNRLVERFPAAQRVHGIKGIYNAFVGCARLSKSEYFYLVDGDSEIKENFEFDFPPDTIEKDCIYVWKSMNPVNGLVSGAGGVKLVPKGIELRNSNGIDISHNITKNYVRIAKIASITQYNSSPYLAWRTAFRECVKLASSVVGENEKDRTQRLKVWCNVGANRRYGRWSIMGACLGREYGKQNQSIVEALQLVNDYEWLREQFNIERKLE